MAQQFILQYDEAGRLKLMAVDGDNDQGADNIAKLLGALKAQGIEVEGFSGVENHKDMDERVHSVVHQHLGGH